MAVEVVVPGACAIKIQVPSGSLLTLGYARNEPEVIPTPFYHNIHSDQQGGDEGPEVEKQFLGAVVIIRIRMSKFDKAVMDVVEKFMSSASTVGTPGAAGSLMFAGNNYLRVLLHSPLYPLNFVRCVLTSPTESNHGTKAAEKYLEFTAYANDAGLVWNAVTS